MSIGQKHTALNNTIGQCIKHHKDIVDLHDIAIDFMPIALEIIKWTEIRYGDTYYQD